MKFFQDCEFNERPGSIDLISIAVACEDGREFYAVSSEFDEARCNDWVRANVLPKLPPRETWRPRAEIVRRLLEFVGEAPEFWGYYADYDWVAICWLFGSMVDLPAGWPMFCLDLRQSMHERGIVRSSLPPDPARAHDALEDARWLRDAWRVVFGSDRGTLINRKASAGAHLVEVREALARVKPRDAAGYELARVRVAQAEVELEAATKELASLDKAVS